MEFNSGFKGLIQLARLLAREHFILLSGCENSKLYARNFDGIVQYGTTASAVGNSKLYTISLKLFKNNSVVIKSSGITDEKKRKIVVLDLCQSSKSEVK